MTPAMEARLKAARRDQRFSNAPMGIGQCGLRAAEVAIFPVRYALDESPQEKGSPQGPHPLPKGWAHSMPPLTTRSYTLRQLRDGWLYVWNSIDQTFHEYEVRGEFFIRHKWTEAQLNQDKRSNPGKPLTYLLYPRGSQLRIAFSPVQWTWRLCELMRSNVTQQQRWMRHVDLPGFCRTGTLEQGARITELGKYVADILLRNEPEGNAPTFDSTTLPTRQNEASKPHKPAFEECLVRGLVPEQDTALFVALDDPLALVDDLAMNLMGRRLEQTLFLGEQGQKLYSARAVQSLCGIDTLPLIPKTLKDKPIEQQLYINDVYELLQAHDAGTPIEDQDAKAGTPLASIASLTVIDPVRDRFLKRWEKLPERQPWSTALAQWQSKRLWREDVHFDKVCAYLRYADTQAVKIKTYCERSEQDLLAWLKRLEPNAEAVYHDTCQPDQAEDLLKTADMLCTLLGNDKKGQQWLQEQATVPNTLFGLALSNFSPELDKVLRQLTHNYSTLGTLDDQGRQADGSSPGMNPSSPGDLTSLATRANELKGVLDQESVRNSKLYQGMSEAGKSALNTLLRVANDGAKQAWHNLGALMQAALPKESALLGSVIQVLFSREIASDLKLAYNPHYARDIQRWHQQVQAISARIVGEMRTLQAPSHHYDRRAARHSLQHHQAQMKALFLQRPNQIIGQASGISHLPADLRQIQNWLKDLGQVELAEQQKLAGSPAYAERTRHWMNQNLGQALPTLVLGLNVWNLANSAAKARNDGQFTADEWRIVGANAAYTGNALAALWVGPAWSRAGSMTSELGGKTLKLAQAGYVGWLKQSQTAVAGSIEAAKAKEFAAASRGLIRTTATWAGLGAVAAGLEAWQTLKDIDKATSTEEEKLLGTKLGVLGLTSLLASAQLIGLVLGRWLPFAWVMSTPVTITILLLGLAYLIISVTVNSLKRESLRLWLYRCAWGKGAPAQPLTNEIYLKELKVLQEVLLRPTVIGGGVILVERYLVPKGFWIQVQLPASLAGKALELKLALVQQSHHDDEMQQVLIESFQKQFMLGHWVDPKRLGALPYLPGDPLRQADFAYTDNEQHRLWQAWIGTSTSAPVIELEIKYPKDVFGPGKQRSYMFRVAIDREANEADRLEDTLSGELSPQEKQAMTPVHTSMTLTLPEAIKP